jgi:tetratricopeptide (TPR) repeat protein
MGVDDRRDHSFTVPKQLRPRSTNPSACLGCHKDKDSKWHNKFVDRLFTRAPIKTTAKTDWTAVNEDSRRLDLLSVRGLAASANDINLAPIIRATMIEQLANFPSRVAFEVAVSALEDKDPMIRRAAVSSLGFLPAAERWSLLSGLVDDDSRSVRFDVAATMANVVAQLPLADQEKLNTLLSEYRDSLSHTLDSPNTQLGLANLEMWLGNFEGAEKHFEAALNLSPGFVPALLNFAEYQRLSDKETESKKLLLKSLEVAPDSAGAQHAYGLYLVRQKKMEEAISYLQIAATIETAQPRYAYVYAVGLDNIGSTDEAIAVLKGADERWPNQIDILSLLLMYAEKLNQLDDHLTYLSKLSAIAPASPLVKRLIQNYQR